MLTWHEFEGCGRILWSHSGETGIGFYDPIPREWLIAKRDLGQVDDRERNWRHGQEWVTGQTRN